MKEPRTLNESVAQFCADGLGIGGMHLRVSKDPDGMAAIEEPPDEYPPGAKCYGCGEDATPGYWFNGEPACAACILETGQYLGILKAETYGLIGSRRDKRAPWDWRHR